MKKHRKFGHPGALVLGVYISFFMGLSALGGELKVFNDNGCWCWYQDERAIISDGKLIIGSIADLNGAGGSERNSDVEVVEYDIAKDSVPVRSLLKDNFGGQGDDHNTCAFETLPDGRILAMYALHGQDEYIYYRITTNPNDTTSWGPEQKITTHMNVTYSNIHRLSAENNGRGRIYDFYRPNPKSSPYFYYSDDNAQTWKAGGWFLNQDRHRPYLKYFSNGLDTIHFSTTEGHPSDFDNSIYHGFVKGGQVYQSDGTLAGPLGSGIEVSSLTKVFQGSAMAIAWTVDTGIDERGLPCVVFSVNRNLKGITQQHKVDGTHKEGRALTHDDIRYHYARFDGTQWIVNEMAYAGTALYSNQAAYSGLVAIDPHNPNIVYISSNSDPVSGNPLISKADNRRHWEIFRGVTADYGQTWKWEPITYNSTADNLRPIIPEWKEEQRTVLLWLYGKMNSYADFKLKVVGMFDPEPIDMSNVAVLKEYEPTRTKQSPTYQFDVLTGGTAGSGQPLIGQDGWRAGAFAGSPGVRVAIGEFGGRQALYSSTGRVSASRLNDEYWGYEIGSDDRYLTLQTQIYAGGSHTAAVGLGCDLNGNGVWGTLQEKNELAFLLAYAGSTKQWSIQTSGKAADRRSSSFIPDSRDLHEVRLEIDLKANGGNGSGSLFVREIVGFTGGTPGPADWAAVEGLQNIDMEFQSMAPAARNPSSWNGMVVMLQNRGGIAGGISPIVGKDAPGKITKASVVPSPASKPATLPAATPAATKLNTSNVSSDPFRGSETDRSSSRFSKLNAADQSSVVRLDVDNDGDVDILEAWWNGKRCRWIDENDNMSLMDIRGDRAGDALQVDRDGDGFYDGPGDLNVKWVDHDHDGDSDLQVIVVHPQAKAVMWSTLSNYMVFIDADDDGVNGYIDWETFAFPCWRTQGRANFSPDYNGDSVFLKIAAPAFAVADPRFNWENPFVFYDFDDDGCSEMTIRYADSPREKNNEGRSEYHLDGIIEDAFISYDLDNDSQAGNELDLDMSLHFYGGEGIEYASYANKFPDLKAPEWALPYYRYENWRTIDELIFVPKDLCYAKTFEGKWGAVNFIFDEDDDDHRWERVELYHDSDPYVLQSDHNKKDAAGKTLKSMTWNRQCDTLGDRAEFDRDGGGKGLLYVGKWDNKLHLYGAESGVWLVDRNAEFFGSPNAPPASSREMAPTIQEVVHYKDTNANGFIDLIEYDYDGNKTIDFSISLLDFGSDESQIISPETEEWEGLHKLYNKLAKLSWNQAQELYNVMWRKGLTDKELDDLAIAASPAEKHRKSYWLKQTALRNLCERYEGDEVALTELKRIFIANDYAALDDLLKNKTSRVRTYATFVPERQDDFAWENDLIAFRAYGPASRENSENAGIDCWLKRVDYPIVDKWYDQALHQGKSYHEDHGEGLDNYHVGSSAGCGGTALWINDKREPLETFVSWEILQQSAAKTVFVLNYEKAVGASIYKERKKVTIEQGKRLFQVDSTFWKDGRLASGLPIAVGLTTHDRKATVGGSRKKGWVSTWEVLDGAGLGTAIVMDPDCIEKAKEIKSKVRDESHVVFIAKTDKTGSLRYYAGYGWEKAGAIRSADDWKRYLNKK